MNLNLNLNLKSRLVYLPPISEVNCSNVTTWGNSTTCAEQIQLAHDIAFATSLVINFVVFSVLMVLFMFVRKRAKPVYEPMALREKAGKNVIELSPTHDSLFGWLKSAWAISDTEIELKRGPHSILYLTVLKVLFFIMLGYGLYGWLI